MSYGYLDQYKILHIVDDEATAKKYATTKVVPTDIPNNTGYPITESGTAIKVYVKDAKYKVGGVEAPISQLGTYYPAVDALVKEILA